jgi:hypothetical protein
VRVIASGSAYWTAYEPGSLLGLQPTRLERSPGGNVPDRDHSGREDKAMQRGKRRGGGGRGWPRPSPGTS